MKRTSLIYLLSVLLLLGCGSDDGGGGNEPDGPDRSANLLGAGDSAQDILSNERFTSLRIELLYVEGFAPTQQAITAFENYLRERTFKEVIDFDLRSIPSPGEEDFDILEIAEIENENRTVFNEGDVLGIYIFFADAPDSSDEMDQGLVTLGSVYRNTSMVIYESTIRQLASQSFLITNADVESATLNHEFGHLLGLVDLGTPTINDHEDVLLNDNDEPILDAAGNPVGNNHCNIEGCLMRAELQFGQGIMGMLESRIGKGLVVPQLDTECIIDLQANGGR